MSTSVELGYQPSSLLMQWHITERCNLQCAHCYQEGRSYSDLSFDDLLLILRQFRTLLRHWRSTSEDARPRGHITVTGGEPFVRSDFLELLQIFHCHRSEFSFAILTNGSLIEESIAGFLRAIHPSFVQVSIEGSRITHDRIRGAGNFDRTVDALKLLTGSGIRTLISFTAHQGNYREFPDVASLGRKYRVARVWADRLIPCGNGANLREQVLTPEETREFFGIMANERKKAARAWFGRTEIGMHRALQFLAAGTKAYHCKAGDSLITVQPNGDLLPCRRMPICVGNLLHTPLQELYSASDVFRRLRDHDRISEGCHHCSHQKSCRGGLKCLSYAIAGTPFAADPGCWVAQRPVHR